LPRALFLRDKPRNSTSAARAGSRLFALALFLLAAFHYFYGATGATAADFSRDPELQVFVRPGCPHCERAKRFLPELQRRHPEIRLRVRDISSDPQALEDLTRLAEAAGIAPVGVPAFHVRGQLIVGFVSPETTGKVLESLIAGAEAPPRTAPRGVPNIIDAPLIGSIDVRDLGLPLFTIVLGLLDGLNPCAMWVLLFLLSMLINLQDRKKMFLIGAVFVIVSGAVYFAFMAAWLNLFLLIGLSRTIQIVLGAVALLAAGLNLKDAFANGSGPSLGIPEAAKPGIYRQVRRIVRAENLPGSVCAVLVLAILVNTVELLCTAGLPAIYTQVLTTHALPGWAYYGYLLLYNAAYMADDSLMLIVAVTTLSRHKLQESGGRWLKLLSGVVMLLLGLMLLLFPQWLAV
jgi:glutaredoxin